MCRVAATDIVGIVVMGVFVELCCVDMREVVVICLL